MKIENIAATVYKYMCALNIPITSTGIRAELEKHPNQESIFAVNDILNHWNVPNECCRVRFEDLSDLSLPFIMYLNTDVGELVLVEKFDNRVFIVSNERWDHHRVLVRDIRKSYNGIILIAEKDDTSGEHDYGKKRRKEILNNVRQPALITAISLLGLSVLFNIRFSPLFFTNLILLFILKTAGLVSAIFLLIQSIDAGNPLIKRICTADPNKNCNAILNSAAAKVTEELSWSEIGFFYFCGTYIALLFNAGSIHSIAILALFNLMCLPYTVYSIYYQFIVARQWCIFCCTVQLILWLEFFAFLPVLKEAFVLPRLADLLVVLQCLCLPVIFWAFIKPYLLRSQQVAPLSERLRKFKYNDLIFNSILSAQTKFELLPENDTIIIGNPQAENVITMVSNPYCGPCAKAHKELDNWMSGRDNVKIQIVFLTNNHVKDRKVKVATHLMSIGEMNDPILLKKALNAWYGQEQHSYDEWVKTYPIPKKTKKDLQKQKDWCETAKIQATPTFMVNGFSLPDAWSLEEIKYFL